MSNILPVGTYIHITFPANSIGTCFTDPDGSDMQVYQPNNLSSTGQIVGSFPLGFMKFGMNEIINEVYYNFTEEVKESNPDNWGGMMFYIVSSDRDSRYYVLPSGYVRRD